MTIEKPKQVDMSPIAVAGRMEDLRQLYRLMLSFRTIRILGPLSELDKGRST